MRKKILFVINTLSRAGAEMALLELLRKLDKEDTYELSLFVLMGQGEMIDQLPPGVHVVNERYIRTSVLEEKRKKQETAISLRKLPFLFGGPSGTRTPDRPVMSRLL